MVTGTPFYLPESRFGERGKVTHEPGNGGDLCAAVAKEGEGADVRVRHPRELGMRTVVLG
jgi:hypothetical protein